MKNINGGKQKPSLWGLSIPNTKLSLVLSVMFIIGYIATAPKAEIYKAPVELIEVTDVKEKTLTEKQLIVKKIAETFPAHREVMVAIALEESRLNPNAVGYNCRYKIASATSTTAVYDELTNKRIEIDKVYKEYKKGYVISTYCRAGHQKFAWSKDGGIFQTNGVIETDIDKNLQLAKEKYDTQGLKAWVSYNTGRYQKHLVEAKVLLKEV